MKMEVEIISKEFIQPSSPTPYHLKNHKLSFLDLYMPSSYMPLVIYYPMNQESNLSVDHMVSIRLQVLKKSLSETLPGFYPFAGKRRDFVSINCNDQGVYFVEARVESSLDEFLRHPDNVCTSKFLPDSGQWVNAPTSVNYVAGAQITTFACRGIAIGACVSHMIADGIAFTSFIKSWAATAHKNTHSAEPIIIQPKFDGSSLFPQNDAYLREACTSPLFTSHIKSAKFVTRRFVFDPSALANLKAKIKSSVVQNPSRAQAVTALLGKCIMTSLKARFDSNKPFLLNYAVNLRGKSTPPFSEYDIGNFVRLASAAVCNDKGVELRSLVSQMREAITKVNGDFINSLKGDAGLLNFLEVVNDEREACRIAEDSILFSSGCNFGLYDIDFGWGKPSWVSVHNFSESPVFLNYAILMDTKLGGIEAWVFLPEEDMATLQRDQQLVEFAAVDPSPLEIRQGRGIVLGRPRPSPAKFLPNKY